MEKIEISVIMGSFNPENKEHLLQAVQSIINQSFKRWEMLIYDDGSNAGPAVHLQEAAALDERIRYIRNDQNHGLAYALNQCITQAKGRYIARMDDDDISKPQRLERLYDFLETHQEYHWVGSNSELIDDQGVWGREEMQEIPEKEDFLKYSPYIHPAVMFRKDILVKSKGYLVTEETRRCEDYELFMRLHKEGYKGYNIQEDLLQYREDSDAYKKRKYKYRFQEMNIRYKGFRDLGILKLKTSPYVLKPLAVGLFTPELLEYIKKTARKNQYVKQQRSGQTGSV